MRFDVRYLPGAVEALSRLGQRGGGRLVNTVTMDHVELVVQHGVSWLEQGFPNEESYDGWVDSDLAEQERAGERYLHWLTETGQSDSDDAYLEWQAIEEGSDGQNGESDDTLSPESPPASDRAASSVLAARIDSSRPPARRRQGSRADLPAVLRYARSSKRRDAGREAPRRRSAR